MCIFVYLYRLEIYVQLSPLCVQLAQSIIGLDFNVFMFIFNFYSLFIYDFSTSLQLHFNVKLAALTQTYRYVSNELLLSAFIPASKTVGSVVLL